MYEAMIERSDGCQPATMKVRSRSTSAVAWCHEQLLLPVHTYLAEPSELAIERTLPEGSRARWRFS